MIAWLMANWGLIAAFLLTISEGLALLFPSATGFGGILAGMIKILKQLGVKDASGK